MNDIKMAGVTYVAVLQWNGGFGWDDDQIFEGPNRTADAKIALVACQASEPEHHFRIIQRKTNVIT